MVNLVDRGVARAAVRAGGGARLAGRDARRSCRRHRHVPARRAPAHRRQRRGGSGRGRRRGAIAAAAKRLFGFELQFGPFAVAQLRLLAEMRALTKAAKTPPPRTQPLHHRHARQSLRRGGATAADRRGDRQIAARGQQGQERAADHRCYRQSAVQGQGGRARRLDRKGRRRQAPSRRSTAGSRRPNGASARTRKHLKNLYVYFWRWATLKVFGSGRYAATGDAGHGRGRDRLLHHGRRLSQWAGLRENARRPAPDCSDIWVIDCSPEGHQPDVPTRIFQGVQQPVCIVLAARKLGKDEQKPAHVRFRALAERQARGKVRRARGAVARHERLDRLSCGLARAFPAGVRREVGEISHRCATCSPTTARA